ncbi:MAG TPA: glycogen debranching N-terminal domain-containing protein [Acidimicrobiales bacterium]|nr:glycogen debranching N-terminal domain-containing protein [Acidimicrobiales bacterium]
MTIPELPPGRLVMLVEGAAFCLCGPGGDIDPARTGAGGGLYVAGRRLLSRCVLRVNGLVPEPVDHHLTDPATAVFVVRAAPAAPGGRGTVVVRRRALGAGLRDDIDIRNAGDEPTYVEVVVDLGADLADVAAVRAGQTAVEPVDAGGRPGIDGEVLLVRGKGTNRVGSRVTASAGVVVDGATLRWEAIVPARGVRRVSVGVAPIVEGAEMVPGALLAEGAPRSESARRRVLWQQGLPHVTSDNRALDAAIERGTQDLGALRVHDTDVPERVVVAAGAPWHLALHGRDALLTAWMGLIADPGLALGTLEMLARNQGADVDDRTEEQPGRILHHLRLGPGARRVSYGAVDTTPLFVMLLGELRRWGLSSEVVDRLLGHADRALDWITVFGDRDGDGYVEYQRATDRGERHQAWKDSDSPIAFADGTPARGPIAVAEVQGYVYAAFRARAHFAAEEGDEALAASWAGRAAELKAAFNRDFWLDDAGWFALALDGDKVPVPSLASNVGHCLWTGIVDEDKAAVLVKHLLTDDMFSGWGIRTLAASAAGYDPVGRHTGTVWPHDNALCVAGLVRYGFVEEAHRVLLAQLDAAASDGGRLSVLCGFDRDDVRAPVRFPDDCTTRAWSAAAPLAHLRSLLRFDPHVPQGRLWLSPVLPDAITRLQVARIPLVGGMVTVTVDRGDVAVDDLPPGVAIVPEPRRPLAAGA